MKTEYRHICSGTCSRCVDITLEGAAVADVKFTGGCDGNIQGVCRLVQGMDAKRAISLLRGIRCGAKSTSCPDQLARGLEEALAQAGR